MKNRLIYVELKSGHGDIGPAWIGLAATSKTGITIYTNGKALKRMKGGGIVGNYYDIETGDEYWISGIKKNNQDRHWAGGGDILIDRAAVKAWFSQTGRDTLPKNLIETDLLPAAQQQHQNDLEHGKLGDNDPYD